ncbi:hypothetical protein G5V65_16135 [Rhodobacter sp. HX-7-19]|jgi:hypothetical protein|uniref:Uncharacterized protein n=1 Tax=Paragemmobacter kunshanensis TaxID=2583234 RepID=A0A6M1TVH8_9RHOB|nr:DUF6522 family protein [Rhodobacter kunshanensis]NGQ92428.1 hypothetical protein [Rhodobacter kunshanensis]
MSGIEREGDRFVVPAALLAEAFGLPEEMIRQAMGEGRMKSLSEMGEGRDAGRWRLTFRLDGQACRFIVDETGAVLARSRFPIGPGGKTGP